MNGEVPKRSNRIPVMLAVLGIAIELVAVALLATKTIPITFGIPLVMAGMFLAFVPMFVLARRARDKQQR